MDNTSTKKNDKKKRGRKPKNNIIVNDNPIHNIVLRLKGDSDLLKN